jgi:hypothetical protein
MDYRPGGGVRPRGHHLDPKYAPLLAPAITAVAMSFAISLVTTTVRLGFTSNLLWSWLTSFAIAVAVAIPTAIVVAPRAQRLVGRLTGATLQRRGDGGSARSTDPNHQAREAD